MLVVVVVVVLACWGARERTRSQKRPSKAHVRPPRVLAAAAAHVAIADAIAAAAVAAAAAALSFAAHLLLLFLAPASQTALPPLAALPAAPALARTLHCTYLLCLVPAAAVPLTQGKKPEMGAVAVVERATLATDGVPVEVAAIVMAMRPPTRSMERHCRSSGRGRSPDADMRCNSNTGRCTLCRPAALLRCSLPILDKGKGDWGATEGICAECLTCEK